jgi:hypothetical protein
MDQDADYRREVKKTVNGFASAARPIGIDGESWTTGR